MTPGRPHQSTNGSRPSMATGMSVRQTGQSLLRKHIFGEGSVLSKGKAKRQSKADSPLGALLPSPGCT